jgi:hypothetical protein
MWRTPFQIRRSSRVVATLVMATTAVAMSEAPSLRAGIIEPHITASVDIDEAAPGTGIGVRVECETSGSPADFVTAILESLDNEPVSSTQVALADAREAWMRLVIPPETPPGDYSVWFLCAWGDTVGTSTRVPFTVSGDSAVEPPPALIDATTSPTSGPPGTSISTTVSCIAPDGTPATDVRSVMAATGLVVWPITDAARALDPAGAGSIAVQAPEQWQGSDFLVFATCYQQGVALASHSQVFDLEATAAPPTTSPVDPGSAPTAAAATPSFTG